jgi:hypothetical protein|tara:strand:- start:401 stop:829 length:429 start_codon:yes stop_codon:yes gene_type:complete
MANFHSFSPNDVSSTDTQYYSTIELVAGDTMPELNIILKDSNTALAGQTLDATNHATWAIISLAAVDTVKMKFRKMDTTTLLETITCSIVGDGTAGNVIMTWLAATLSGASGIYEGEIEVTYNSGKVSTIRDLLKFDVRAGF